MPVVIHWCCLVAEQRQFVQASLEELAERLQLRYPELPRIELADLTVYDDTTLLALVDHHLPITSDKPACPESLLGKRPFVFCRKNDTFVIRAKGDNDVPEWGLSYPGYF